MIPTPEVNNATRAPHSCLQNPTPETISSPPPPHSQPPRSLAQSLGTLLFSDGRGPLGVAGVWKRKGNSITPGPRHSPDSGCGSRSPVWLVSCCCHQPQGVGGLGEWGGGVREGTAPKGRRLQASKLCTMSKPSCYRVAPCRVRVGARTLNSRRCSRGLPLPAAFLLGNWEGSFQWSLPPVIPLPVTFPFSARTRAPFKMRRRCSLVMISPQPGTS